MTRYRFGQVIGSGGFGEVLAATRVDDGFACAVKRLREPYTSDDLRRFRREVKIQAQLRHKHILPLLGVNLEASPPWFVMPRASLSLRQFLKQHGGGEQHVWVIRQIAAGLAYAHANGVMHRDLKPENVLFLRDINNAEFVAVSDFGLGRFIERESPSITSTNAPIGTVEYMAPEQYADAKNVDHRADIFALGKILYEVLTGECPYPNGRLQAAPRKFAYVIQKACQPDLERRYQNVQEVISDLELVVEKRDLLSRPAETIRTKIQTLVAGTTLAAEDMTWLVKMFVENADDNVVLTELLPHLPDPILRSLVEQHLQTMMPVLKAYDLAVSEALPFNYCDIVADFYAKLFWWALADEVKVMVLRRLPILAFSHNRWHVGQVFGRIAGNLRDPALIMAVRDVLKQDPHMAQWCKPYLEIYSLPQAIRSVLKGQGV